MRKQETLEVRFWAKVKKGKSPDDCWGWSAAKSDDGYGWIRLSQIEGMAHAHRVSWKLHFRKIPRGLYVLHHCDNTECTNPKHLFLGTQIDNMADMTKKGRRIGHGGSKGEANHSSKLNDQKVREIRALYATGKFSHEQIAKKYGMTASPICAVIRRKSWKHVQ